MPRKLQVFFLTCKQYIWSLLKYLSNKVPIHLPCPNSGLLPKKIAFPNPNPTSLKDFSLVGLFAVVKGKAHRRDVGSSCLGVILPSKNTLMPITVVPWPWPVCIGLCFSVLSHVCLQAGRDPPVLFWWLLFPNVNGITVYVPSHKLLI